MLSDPDLRRRYDRSVMPPRRVTAAGRLRRHDFGDFGGGLDDFFDMFFGGATRSPGGGDPSGGRFALRPSPRLHGSCLWGGEELISPVWRLRCGGDGAEPGSSMTTVPIVRGQGDCTVQRTPFGQFVNARTCPRCRGEGRRAEQTCRECGGQGRVNRRRRLKVKIPAGVEEGQRVRLAGEGEGGLNGGPPGDLYLYITVKPHELFRRRGNDIYCEIPISFVQAALGDESCAHRWAARLGSPRDPNRHLFRLRAKECPIVLPGRSACESQSGYTHQADPAATAPEFAEVDTMLS